MLNIFLDMADTGFAWLKDAACGDMSAEDYAVFFPPHSQAGNQRQRAMCGSCVAQRDCLIFAYTQGLEFGYFGGLSPHARARMPLEEALSLISTDELTENAAE